MKAQPSDSRIQILLAGLFVICAVGLTVAGFLSYSTFRTNYRDRVAEQLSAVAHLKVERLAEWRQAQLSLARFAIEEADLLEEIPAYLRRPQPGQLAEGVQNWLEALRAFGGYQAVYLTDLQGGTLLSAPADAAAFERHGALPPAEQALTAGPQFLDFHQHPDGRIHLAVLAPVKEAEVVLGFLVLDIDPAKYLYPFLNEWPVPTASAETLLVRREGEEVVFLNALRFQPQAALKLRLSLENTQVLAVRGGLGERGVMEGQDYRGVAVVGAVVPVPGTDWILIAKMDQAELYAPLAERLRSTILVFAALLALTASILLVIWWQQRLQAHQALRRYSEELEAKVSERTRQLQAMQEQLVAQERLAVLGQLAGGVGHELRNPLGVIANAVAFLQMVQTDAPPKIQEYLTIIEQEVRRADRIITDLLIFARHPQPQPREVRLGALLQQVLQAYPPPPAINLRLELPEDLPPLWADPDHLEYVLGNVVQNACQAMQPEEGILDPQRSELRLSAALQGDRLCLQVQDQGPGMSAEQMRHLFEPLFTTKLRGIGLGLAISKRLLEANGGSFAVTSQPGQGSIFSILVPIKEVL